ncbi:hypothetical protein PRIC1_003760 [Phytophthora ramorum]
MSLKRAFVALQERFVSSLAVACCPTMDLVAVLTLDHHLLVHRTTSWQKLLHIKPSDVAFEMVTLAWRPDGLQLAVGCGEGDVAIFEIESGETLPERRSSSRHEHYITAMHWAQINEVESPRTGSGSRNKRCRRKVSGSLTGASSGDFTSQSKLQFRRRSSRFLAGYSDEVVGENTVLVTADAGGFIALWWMGSVLLTRIDIRTHFTDEEVQSMESMGHQRGDTSGFRIERVDLAPDLSLLFVLVVFPSCSQGGDSVDGGSHTKLHRMLTLDMTGIERINEDVALVASTIDRVHTILNRIVTTGKQMTTEWKNAMRIFELKMGLIGSLYEKYACEDPPQVDMLSVVVSGITAPALAQYFAQDIQEMSVHRMQKALFSGCDTLRTLVDEKLKCDLVDLLFLISELRGHAKWSSKDYADRLGFTVSALDDLVKATQDTLVELETLTLAIHETRQDFALLFQWIMERISVHTNSNQMGGATGASGGNANRDAGGSANGSKSLLNLRRLCDFLQRAAESARRFRTQQPSHNTYKVETTFGNPVSRQLSARPDPPQNSAENTAVGCLVLFKRIEDQWLVLLDAMTVTSAKTIPYYARKNDNIAGDDQSDENEEEAIDWHSLRHYGPVRNVNEKRCAILMGFRLQSGVLLLLRAFQDCDSQQLRCDSPPRLAWSSAVVSFSQGSSSNPVTCESFDFYGDVASAKAEQLAVVLNRTPDGQAHQAWLYLLSYDNIEFSPAAISSTSTLSSSLFKALLTKSPTHNFRADRIRGRSVGPATPRNPGASVIATASRGVLCVTLPPSRLTVLDAEDSEDEDDNENEEVGNHRDEED